MAAPVNRKKVKEFFTWQKSQWRLKWGAGLVILGVVVLAVVPAQTVSPAIAVVALLIGAGLLAWHFMAPNSFGQLYGELVRAKHHDITRLLERGYRRVSVDIDDLLNFEADDLIDFDLQGEEPDLLEKLHKKSVILFGPSASFENVRIVRTDNRSLAEFNPIQVSVLFLTRDRLMTYDAQLDLTRGDLNSEAVGHIFLRDVVQIATHTTTTRLKREQFPGLFDDFKRTTGKSPAEIVRRDHTVQISKTDGHNIVLPIGAPEYQDGTQGSLDSTSTQDDRYTRIAQQMSARIQDTKTA